MKIQRRSILVAVLCVFSLPGLANADGPEGKNPGLRCSYASLDVTEVRCKAEGYELVPAVTKDGEYLALSLEGVAVFDMDRAGVPQIPAFSRSLMIPDRARMDARIVEERYHEIALDAPLLPWRGPIPRTVDPSTVPFVPGPMYGKDTWYPEKPFRLGTPYILHDVRGMVVTLCPFQYNPVRARLRVYDALAVEVYAAGEGAVNLLDRTAAPPRPDRTFEAIYRGQFANYRGNRTEPPSEYGNLLVICHGPFMAAMEPFVAWKNATGINTTIKDVAKIGNDPDAIKAYIQAVYDHTNLAYVLLVGDRDQVQSPVAGGLSDPSYGTLTPDWYPDLLVGRFSAQTAAQVETQVARTVAYEQQDHDVSLGGWNAMGMGIASNQGAGAGHYGEADYDHVKLIRNELKAYGFTYLDRIVDPNASKWEVTAGLNEGRRLVVYTGHGSTTSWGTTGFSNGDVYKLKNMGMLPFIQSVACVNGAFGVDTCFAEAWMRATHNGEPIGAIACYMSSINQYWAEPMYAQGNHAKGGQLGAAERFWMEENTSVCGEWFGGSCIMMDICGSAGRDMFRTWICFGDPSLRVLGGIQPETLAADGWAVPLDTAVTIHFTVQPGPAFAGDAYFLLAGASGDKPGTPLPGGTVLPLNLDALSTYVMSNPGGGAFQGFAGILDGQGQATAAFTTAGAVPLDPSLAGLCLTFAAAIQDGSGAFAAVTNAKVLTVTE